MSESPKMLKALRGAICTCNTAAGISSAAAKLYDALLQENALSEADLVSVFFSVTPDLFAMNPAAALRQSGRAGELAMMVFQEAAVQDGLQGAIRLLVHCYLGEGRQPRHVYLDGAEVLRPDWAAPGP